MPEGKGKKEQAALCEQKNLVMRFGASINPADLTPYCPSQLGVGVTLVQWECSVQLP